MSCFKQYFDRYLAARHSRHLFRSRTTIELLPGSQRNNAQSDVLNSKLVNQARAELPELLTQLDSSEQGLSAAQVLTRRGQYGLNQVEQEHAIHWWRHLWLSYSNPFSLLLTLMAAVSFLTKDMQGAAVISSR